MERNYTECCDAVVNQILWWFKIGAIRTIDMSVLEEAIDLVLSDDEQWMCINHNPRYMYEDILWNC